MSYRPRVKNNACTNAHPVGCYYNVYGQMLNAIDRPIKSSEGQTALVIGSSSGAGLATRIALTFAAAWIPLACIASVLPSLINMAVLVGIITKHLNIMRDVQIKWH
mgnify:CR=1 FL=1